MPANLLLRKARRFVRLPRFQRAWLAPTWLLLGAARAAALCGRFERIASRLGESHGLQARVPLVTPAQLGRARQVSQVIRLAARYTPWDSNCFAQAIVARALLGRYGIPCTVFFGLRRGDTASRPLLAHAWVCAGRAAVTGGPGAAACTVVASFTWPREA